MGRIAPAALHGARRPEETSREVAARVASARGRQEERAGQLNSHLEGRDLERFASLDEASRQLLVTAAERLALSMRACHRIMRVARSIADLAGSADIRSVHLAEAVALRTGLCAPASDCQPLKDGDT